MSAVALFYQLPKSAIDGLREVAVPKKQWLGAPKDEFWEYLKQHGREVANYPGSGYVLGDVMDWLQQEHRIELERSRYEELCNFVGQARGSTHCILSIEHQRAHLERLDPEAFSNEEFLRYYNEFHGTHETDLGSALSDGIETLRQALMTVDENSVVFMIIG